METYKLYRLYDNQIEKTLKQLHVLYKNEEFHFPAEQLVAIQYKEEEHSWKEIYDKMANLDVSQAMFLSTSMRELIQFFGKKRCQISIEFTDKVEPSFLSLIKGYIQRIETESNELLRMEDLRHLLSYLHFVSHEQDVDIRVLSIEVDKETFHVYNNGIVEVFSKEYLDKIAKISFQK